MIIFFLPALAAIDQALNRIKIVKRNPSKFQPIPAIKYTQGILRPNWKRSQRNIDFNTMTAEEILPEFKKCFFLGIKVIL